MKKYILFVLIIGLVAFSCTLKNPTQPDIKGVTQGDLALTKMVAIGNSLTAGFQSAGLVEEYQLTSYPYQIAKQMGVADDFQQPLIADPGISTTPGVGVLDFNPATGAIEPRGTYTNPMALLRNALLPRPYDNLGVPGADLNDALNTVNGSGGNPFFDLILRNPNFGNTTMWQQAKLLKPTMVLLWIGNNDVLGAALDGGDMNQITSAQDFQSRYATLLTNIAGIRPAGQLAIFMANIPNVTDIPYVNLLDGLIYKTIPALGITTPVPVVFDATFTPILFDTTLGLYLPLLADEGVLTGGSPVQHVLLPFLSEYKANGLGVPDSTVIDSLLRNVVHLPPPVAAAYAHQLDSAMVANGLNPSGVPIPGNLTLTAAEVTTISGAVKGFNQIIGGIAQSQGIPLVDINALMNEINMTGVDGYSGKFVFFDPANTAFSLDGIHASSGGYALVANRFIEKINQVLGSSIPAINTAQYKGQYTGMNPTTISLEAAKQAKAIFTR
jgi:lysophospholipase L1-like esterase